MKKPGLRAVTQCVSSEARTWTHIFLSAETQPPATYGASVKVWFFSPKDAKWPNWQEHSRILPQCTITNLWSSGHVTTDLRPLSSVAPKPTHKFFPLPAIVPLCFLWVCTFYSGCKAVSSPCSPHPSAILKINSFFGPLLTCNWEGKNIKCPLNRKIKSYGRKRNSSCLPWKTDHLEAVALSYRESIRLGSWTFISPSC